MTKKFLFLIVVLTLSSKLIFSFADNFTAPTIDGIRANKYFVSSYQESGITSNSPAFFLIKPSANNGVPILFDMEINPLKPILNLTTNGSSYANANTTDSLLFVALYEGGLFLTNLSGGTNYTTNSSTNILTNYVPFPTWADFTNNDCKALGLSTTTLRTNIYVTTWGGSRTNFGMTNTSSYMSNRIRFRVSPISTLATSFYNEFFSATQLIPGKYYILLISNISGTDSLYTTNAVNLNVRLMFTRPQ